MPNATITSASLQSPTALRNGLAELLKWWMQHMIDEENGGFYGRRDGHGRLVERADKGVILNTRILWTFAAAARTTGRADYTEIAHRAFIYLCEHFVDTVQGGVYWSVNYRGEPVELKKQIYAQSFAIYAFTEYYRLTQNNAAKELANELFWLIEKYSYDQQHGGYFEAFDRDWQPLTDLRLSNKDVNEAKTMNTHLHVMEAYTNLYRIEPNAAVGAAVSRLLRCFMERFIDPNTAHLHLFFAEDWQLRSHTISYGHDIECSWLMVEAAEVLGDINLQKEVIRYALQMAEVILCEGLDGDGAVYNEKEGNHIDTNRHWWPQAEAVIGFWSAYQLTGDAKFKAAAVGGLAFIQQYLKIPNGGEWYWRINAAGVPETGEDLAGPWKAPYHNGRMYLELLERHS